MRLEISDSVIASQEATSGLLTTAQCGGHHVERQHDKSGDTPGWKLLAHQRLTISR
jgi:hypothetical protein